MWFVWFSYYKNANCTTPCSAVWCGVLLLTVRCDFAILQAILAQFGEHP